MKLNMKSQFNRKHINIVKIYLRLSFGLLMMIYSANKSTSSPFQPNIHLYFNYSQRLPIFISSFFHSFPWYSNSLLYWRYHAALMFLSSACIVSPHSIISRCGCLCFFIFSTAQLLRDQTTYNNHEYMYCTFSLLLLLCNCHGWHDLYLAPEVDKTTRFLAVCVARACLFVALVWLMLNNAVMGIPGLTGMIGVCVMSISLAVLVGIESGSVVLANDSTTAGSLLSMVSSTDTDLDVFCLQLYFALIYFYAGLAKTDTDWLSGSTARELLSKWVSASVNIPRHFDDTLPVCLTSILSFLSVSESTFLHSFALAGLTFDLTVGFGLMCPVYWVRVMFTMLAACFHLTNHWLFVLETFPWVMMLSLVIYHDDAWILILSKWALSITKLFISYIPLKSITAALHAGIRHIRVILLVIFIALHALLPLRCGLSSIGDPGTVSWSSGCQNFNWRMMSRSAQTFSSYLRFKHPMSDDESQILSLDMLGIDMCRATDDLNVDPHDALYDDAVMCREKFEFLTETPQFEDRLLVVIQDAMSRAQAVNTDDDEDVAPPSVYADIWLQINGPPMQRFVRPDVDLAQVIANKCPVFAPIQWNVFVSRHPHLLPECDHLDWLLPRIVRYRSLEWLATMQDLTHREKISLSSKREDHAQILFIAEVVSSVDTHLHVYGHAVLRLLDGVIGLVGVGDKDKDDDEVTIVTAGQEIEVENTVITWRVLIVQQDEFEVGSMSHSCNVRSSESALLMVVLDGQSRLEIKS